MAEETTEPETTPAADPTPTDDPKAGSPDTGGEVDDKGKQPDPNTEPETTPEPADDFDRDRALATIRRQREREKEQDKELKELRARIHEFEDAGRSEEERRAQRLRDLEDGKAQSDADAARAVGEAARLRVVLKKGLTGDQALALAKRLVGETEEELEQDADDLIASFKSDDKPKDEPRRRPQERLKPGTVPDAEPDETDPAKLAGRVSTRW